MTADMAKKWWREIPLWGQGGRVDACLRLFEQGAISRAKCREIVESSLEWDGPPLAPWDELAWGFSPVIKVETAVAKRWCDTWEDGAERNVGTGETMIASYDLLRALRRAILLND